jgi:uncharacterized ferritin-like protein (DUF455 family)
MMRIRTIGTRSEEEKVAQTIANKLDSVSLNLDEVGRYLAGMPNVFYNRFMVVAEAAEFSKELQSANSQKDYLF